MDDSGATTQRGSRGWGRVLAAVVVTVLVCGAATAGAAKLITGADVKDGSLTGKDIKNGSLAIGDLNGDVQKAIPTRVTGGLPTMGFSATNDSVANTKNGVAFGPYADGGLAGGSLCSKALNGKPFSDVKHLAYVARYTATGDSGGLGVPYLRVFLVNNTHDAIFSPNTQSPDPDIEEGPFHTWEATAGSWRYDDDSGIGPDSPFTDIRSAHANEKISKICISDGFSGGTNLSALLLSWEVNSTEYTFGL